jgi:hypothetical protein
MHGIFLYLEPAFLVFLMLATAAALYLGLFKAGRPGASLPRKLLSGIVSGAVACTAWSLMASWYFLSW